MDKRIGWIDTARGISMVLILYFHTEMYYIGYDFIPYGLYVANVLMVFFFISGYLFYKENGVFYKENNNSNKENNGSNKKNGGLHNKNGFSLKHKLRSIARGIVMPYFIFTTAMALPKAVVHNNFTSIGELAVNIISGQASWFVTALTVSEIIFAVAVWAAEKYKSGWILPLSSLVSVTAAFTIPHEAVFFWNTNIALMAVLYLYCGYVYHRHEARLDACFRGMRLLPVFILIALVKWYECANGMSMLVFPLEITSFPVFFVDTILSTVFIIGISKIVPTTRLLTFTGRNSIVYYFLCGGIPLTISYIMGRIGLPYGGNHITVVVTFVIVFAAATAATWAICRYIPSVTGRRRSN